MEFEEMKRREMAILIGAMRRARRNEIIQMNSSRKRRASGATLRASCRPIKVRPRPTMRRFHPATSCSSFSFCFQILQTSPPGGTCLNPFDSYRTNCGEIGS